MKKILSALLAASLIVSCFCGCNSDRYASLPDEYVAGTDYPTSFVPRYNKFPIAPGEGGYYFTMGDFLFFMDDESKEIAPVCSRPDCRHENESDASLAWQCNAYTGTFSFKFLQLYEENLYCLSSANQNEEGKLQISESSSLLKVSPDGTTHEILCPMPLNLEFIAIHRGYLYYAYMANETTCTLARKKMDALDEEAEIVFTLSDAYWGYFFPNGWHIYFFASSSDDSLSTAYDYDLRTQNIEKLFDKQIIEGIVDGKLLCRDQSFNIGTESETAFTLYDTKTRESTPLCSVSVEPEYSWPEYATDGKLIYQFLSPRGYPESEEYNRDDGRRVMMVYDMTGKRLMSTDLQNLPAPISFAPGDEKYGFFWYEKVYEEGAPLCLDLLKKGEEFKTETIFRRSYAGLRPDLLG